MTQLRVESKEGSDMLVQTQILIRPYSVFIEKWKRGTFSRLIFLCSSKRHFESSWPCKRGKTNIIKWLKYYKNKELPIYSNHIWELYTSAIFLAWIFCKLRKLGVVILTFWSMKPWWALTMCDLHDICIHAKIFWFVWKWRAELTIRNTVIVTAIITSEARWTGTHKAKSWASWSTCSTILTRTTGYYCC